MLVNQDPTTNNNSPTSLDAYLKADQKFGKIAKPQITSLTLSPGSKATFSLGATLKFAQFPTVVNVYEIKAEREALGDATNARSTAVKLGFNYEESSIQNNIMLWENKALSRKLSFNKVLHQWDYSLNLNRDPEAQKYQTIVPQADFYQTLGVTLLSTMGLGNNLFATGSSKIDFINYDAAGNISQVAAKDLAKYVRISLFKQLQSATLRENYQPKQGEAAKQNVSSDIIKLNYLNGTANFIVQGKAADPAKDIIYFDYKDYKYGDFGVYTSITPEEAWLNVQQNNAYLIWLKPEKQDPYTKYTQLNIREFRLDTLKTRIVYLDPDARNDQEWTHYLHPFYFFIGTALQDDGSKATFVFLANALAASNYQ